jgi:hypothetical protein
LSAKEQIDTFTNTGGNNRGFRYFDAMKKKKKKNSCSDSETKLGIAGENRSSANVKTGLCYDLEQKKKKNMFLNFISKTTTSQRSKQGKKIQ